MNAIELQGLTKYYGRVCGVDGISLTVQEGDFFGFIGPNGAGKSTTIRTLLGLIGRTSGTARVLGREAAKGNTAILAEVGYLPSEVQFYPGMRVRDVLRLSAALRGRDCASRAKRLCERLELDETKRVETLSLGNRKKVGVVCAMQHQPRLYIMDEPTSGLDPLMQREFYALLREENERGATVFLSSHVLTEVQRYCRHAAVIRAGRLLACGSVAELSHTGAKRVTLRGVDGAPALGGVRDAARTPDGVTFLYSGAPKLLLRALCALPVEDVTITEPDLEEIFLHFYEKGETRDDNFPA